MLYGVNSAAIVIWQAFRILLKKISGTTCIVLGIKLITLFAS